MYMLQTPGKIDLHKFGWFMNTLVTSSIAVKLYFPSLRMYQKANMNPRSYFLTV